MAKTSSIQKQLRRERIVQLKWDKRQQLKKIAKNFNSSPEERFDAQEALNKMPRDSSPIRLRNRCQLTGRARGYYRKFKVSRICLREMASKGLIPGMFKASW